LTYSSRWLFALGISSGSQLQEIFAISKDAILPGVALHSNKANASGAECARISVRAARFSSSIQKIMSLIRRHARIAAYARKFVQKGR
jgi:hypothetical protein